jgi:DNA-binding response OmpR family regulator
MARILLIEPDAALSKLYHEVLTSLGHVVHVSRSAQHAVHTTDESLPELIILELQLIGHSGIEFLYELRSYSDWIHIPVVVMSHVPPQEFAASNDLLKKTLGVSEYFYKPQTSLTTLLDVVKRLTAKSEPAIVQPV